MPSAAANNVAASAIHFTEPPTLDEVKLFLQQECFQEATMLPHPFGVVFDKFNGQKQICIDVGSLPWNADGTVGSDESKFAPCLRVLVCCVSKKGCLFFKYEVTEIYEAFAKVWPGKTYVQSATFEDMKLFEVRHCSAGAANHSDSK